MLAEMTFDIQAGGPDRRDRGTGAIDFVGDVLRFRQIGR
jgi:hypothetical protein